LKEQKNVESLVPLLFNYMGSVQAAIDSVIVSVTTAANGFKTIAIDLLQQYQYDNETHAALQRFIDACQINCTGNLFWKYAFSREFHIFLTFPAFARRDTGYARKWTLEVSASSCRD
jgi:hypothetical protein